MSENPYIFPRRRVTEARTSGSTPIVPVLDFLCLVGGHMKAANIPGGFTPETSLKVPIMPNGHVLRARQQADFGMQDKTLGRRLYERLPGATRNQDLTAAFLGVHILNDRILCLRLNGASGVNAERLAARRRLMELAGVELNLPSVEEVNATLGRFGKATPQDFKDRVVATTNTMLDGLNLALGKVEYGFASVIGK